MLLSRPRLLLSPLRQPCFLLPRQSLTPKSISRTYIAAPKPGSGPLLTRRSDRALPSLENSSSKWLKSLPIFAVIMIGSCLAIFNYQKQSSSVVSSTLYALRTNPTVREVLGDEVYFASQIPWIRGELNQMQGRIDIRFWVKGSRGVKGLMRFRSVRKSRMGLVSFRFFLFYFGLER